MQILKRIWSHLLYAKYTGDDEQVRMLTAIIRLHASFAEHYINNHISDPYYAEVVEYAKINGRYPAEQIMQKYGNNTVSENSNQLTAHQ